MAIKSYRNNGTRDIALSHESKESRKTLPVSLHQIARRRLAFLASVGSLADLGSRVGLSLHKLKGNRVGQLAISINDQYRICFVWTGQDADLVEICDYH